MFIERLPLLIDQGTTTAWTIVIGFPISVIVGVIIGLMIVELRWFECAAYPVMVGSQAIPKIALAPIFVAWFGFGPFPRVLVTFLIALFPVVIATVTGLRAIDREFKFMAQSMGLTAWQNFWKIGLPHALPTILAGVKVAITLAVVARSWASSSDPTVAWGRS